MHPGFFCGRTSNLPGATLSKTVATTVSALRVQLN